jgi:hypothetical protein
MWEAEPRLGSLSTTARLMNILEAKHQWKSAAPTRPHTSSRGKTRLAAPTRWGGQKAQTLQRQVHRGGGCRRKSFRRTPTHPIQVSGTPCRAPTQSGMLEMNLQGHGKLWRHKAETLKAKGRRELKGERAPRVGEKQGMAATQGMNPSLKADSPAPASKHREKSPRCTPGYPS